MLKLASVSVLADSKFVELLAFLGTIIIIQTLFFTKLVDTMGERALVPEFANSLSPVTAEFCFEFRLSVHVPFRFDSQEVHFYN